MRHIQIGIIKTFQQVKLAPKEPGLGYRSPAMTHMKIQIHRNKNLRMNLKMNIIKRKRFLKLQDSKIKTKKTKNKCPISKWNSLKEL